MSLSEQKIEQVERHGSTGSLGQDCIDVMEEEMFIAQMTQKLPRHAPEHLVGFRQEFDKVRRTLAHSLEREKSYLGRIKELKARLTETNKQLKTRTAVAESLERQVKRLDEERRRAVRSETFAREREENARKIVMSLKQQLANLETRVHQNDGRSPAKALALARQQYDEEEEKRADELLFQRTRGIEDISPFDQWKKIYGQWTPSAPVNSAQSQSSTAPRAAYELYAATHPGRPHAHELALAHANRVQQQHQGQQKQNGVTSRATSSHHHLETPMQKAEADILKRRAATAPRSKILIS